MKKLFLFPLLALALSACAGSIPGVSYQGAAGVTHLEADFLDGKVTHLELTDGKASASAEAAFNAATGDFSFKRTETTVDGQAVRAVVEQAVAAEVAKTVPSVVDAAVRGAMIAVNPMSGLAPVLPLLMAP